MVRIHYKKLGNILCSTKVVMCNITPTTIQIDITQLSYMLIDNTTKFAYFVDFGDSLQEVKRLAKLKTIQYGAKYLDEIRDSKKRKRKL